MVVHELSSCSKAPLIEMLGGRALSYGWLGREAPLLICIQGLKDCKAWLTHLLSMQGRIR